MSNLSYSTIREISDALAGKYGRQLFRELLIKSNSIIDADFMFIGEVSGQEIETTCLVSHLDEIPNIKYKLRNTPCENVYNNNVCVYKEDIVNLFPKDKLLMEMQVESYIGVPIFNSSKKVVGIWVALFKNKLENETMFLQIMDLFKERIGSELERIEKDSIIENQLYYNQVTQLPNRTCFRIDLDKSIQACKGNHKWSAAYLVDIDHFKQINDNYGHDVGDILLKKMVSRFKIIKNKNISIYHVGVDTFAIIERNIQQDKMKSKIKILKTIEKLNKKLDKAFKIKNHNIDITVSSGICLFNDEESNTTEEILKSLDISLYTTKSKERGGIVLFNSILKKEVQREYLIIKKLKEAISKKEFHVVYQPQYNNEGDLVAAEALLRWNLNGKSISPDEFIPVAEKGGLIYKIGLFVIEDAIKSYLIFSKIKENKIESISVNISPLQLEYEEFEDDLLRLINAYEINPQNIKLEITESVFLNKDKTIEKLSRLVKEGFQLSIDDFGTGYSSLSYLMDLPVTQLKLDKSFVQKIENSEKHKNVVGGILQMCKMLHINTVAEGVETSKELKYLKSTGCDLYQGYYFSKPIDVKDMKEILDNKKAIK